MTSDIPWVATHGRSKFVGEISGERLLAHMQFFNGTFLEFFDALITSDGAVITMTVEQSGGGDLIENFSTGQTRFASTPAATIAITPGTDPAPQLNFVYILQSAPGVLVKDTSDWPADEHIRVCICFVPSASLVNTGAAGNNFAFMIQNINEEAATANGQGHLSHIMDRLRHGGGVGGVWHTGCLGTATQDGNDLWVDIAAGTVAQIHHHDFPALDSDTAGAGDPILVVNDPDGAYRIIHSLNEITKLSTGVAIGNNKFVKFVLSGVANKTGTVSPMLLKLPSNQYNTQADAETDVEGFADFSIPDEFIIQSSTGFLDAAFVCKHTATAMELQSTVDLRGQSPVTMGIGGSVAGGGNVTAAANLTDNALIRGDGGAKGIQDSGWLLDDNDDLLCPVGAALFFGDADTNIGATTGNLGFGVAAGKNYVFAVGGTAQVAILDGAFLPTFNNDIDIGIVGTNECKDGFFAGGVFASVFTSDVVTGTSPYACASETKNTNLHADLLDGSHVGTSGAAIGLLDAAVTRSGVLTFGTNTKLQLRDSANYLQSLAANLLTVNAGTILSLSLGGTSKAVLTSTGLDVMNVLRAESLRADSDAGGGAGTIEYTNTTLANDSTTPTLSRLPTGYAAASAQWVAMNIGATRYVWPVWTI